MLKKITDFCKSFDMLPSGGTVLAAVSGGADSMCMLHILLSLSDKMGFKVAAAHFNHCLRGEESDRDEIFVRDWCSKRGVPFYSSRGDVAGEAKRLGIGTEEAARTMRYAFLSQTAETLGAVRIATAHTADDNLETVIMNLTRGSALRGLCGIPPVRGNIVRPLLPITRDEVVEYLRQHGIAHVEDSTNAGDDYTRNRMRHSVIPVLKSVNPAAADTVFSASRLISEDDGYLDSLADEFLKKYAVTENGETRIPVKPLTASARPVARRAVKKLCGSAADDGHIAAVLALCTGTDGSARAELPSMFVLREYGDLVFVSGRYEERTFSPVTLEVGGTADIPELKTRVRCQLCEKGTFVNKSFTQYLLKKDSIYGKLTVSPRVSGDEINLHSSGCTKPLKKLFIEKRIPKRKRALIPVIRDDMGPVAVYGMGIAQRVYPNHDDTVLKITFEEII